MGRHTCLQVYSGYCEHYFDLKARICRAPCRSPGSVAALRHCRISWCMNECKTKVLPLKGAYFFCRKKSNHSSTFLRATMCDSSPTKPRDEKNSLLHLSNCFFPGLLSRLFGFHSYLISALWPKWGRPVCSDNFSSHDLSLFEMISFDLTIMVRKTVM